MNLDPLASDDDLGLPPDLDDAPREPLGAPDGGASPFSEARALSRWLRSSRAPRTKTGLVFWSEPFWADPRGTAALLDAAPVSLCARLLGRLPPDARAVPLDASGLFDLVSQVSDERAGGDVAWLWDVDALVARLAVPERERFWQAAFERLPHRSRSILLALPLLEGTPFVAENERHETIATHPLGPSREATAQWRDAGRVALLRK